jgi:hypothetical protein
MPAEYKPYQNYADSSLWAIVMNPTTYPSTKKLAQLELASRIHETRTNEPTYRIPFKGMVH